MDPSWIQGHYSAEWWLDPGLGKPTPHSTEYFLCIYMARLVPVSDLCIQPACFREGRKKVCHGWQLAGELLALERLQQGDCAQVSFYIHNLAFIWLTDVLVSAGSSNGTQGSGPAGLQLWARQYLPALVLQVGPYGSWTAPWRS